MNRKISTLKNWDKNPRSIQKKDFDFTIPKYKGLLLGHGWNKGKGMTLDQKKEARKKALQKYNNKPSRKYIVSLWHSQHSDRMNEIKRKYASSPYGILKKKESSHRRMALEKGLKKKINWTYWKWLCNKLNYTCQLCHKIFPIEKLTVDHQLAIKRGGDNDEWNLQPLCLSCNCRKQDRLIGIDNIELDLAYGDWLLCQK